MFSEFGLAPKLSPLIQTGYGYFPAVIVIAWYTTGRCTAAAAAAGSLHQSVPSSN